MSHVGRKNGKITGSNAVTNQGNYHRLQTHSATHARHCIVCIEAVAKVAQVSRASRDSGDWAGASRLVP